MCACGFSACAQSQPCACRLGPCGRTLEEHSSKARLADLAAEAQLQLPRFHAQHVCLQAMSLWAYATLREGLGGACLAALAAEAHKQLPRFDAQHVVNMLWAFAKLEHNPGAALLRACEARAMRMPSSFSGHGLVRCCSDLM